MIVKCEYGEAVNVADGYRRPMGSRAREKADILPSEGKFEWGTFTCWTCSRMVEIPSFSLTEGYDVYARQEV